MIHRCIRVFLIFLLSLQKSLSFTLITFDVDGTLVHGSGSSADTSAHSRSFAHAVSQVFGKGQTIQPVAEALPRELYHGSTDGLILLRLVKATLDIDTEQSFPYLDGMMEQMYQYIAALDDEEIARGIEPLPGVIDTLNQLSTMKAHIMCGLVTGNVEGIARKKMNATGIFQTGALAEPSLDQQQATKGSIQKWIGSEDIGFLGGFGSDYCSGNINDISYNYLDRSRQIEIAVERCQAILRNNAEHNQSLQRVVHVGDAPADVLAAKVFAEKVASLRQRLCSSDNKGQQDPDRCFSNLQVNMIATATGSYSADHLRAIAGPNIPDQWECTVLENGIADPNFLKVCRGSVV